jgi:peptide/nickel transport system permease protein
MTAYIIRRLMQGILVIVLISIFVFLLMRLLPADPLMLYIAQNQLDQISEEDYHNLQVEFGLDKTMPMQYLDWLANVFRGDLGTSIFYNEKVNTLIAERLPVTAYISILALILAIILGVTAGVISALRRGGVVDVIVTSLANFGISIPIFWLGVLLIYFLGLYLKVLPIQGYTSPFTNFSLSIKQLIMPVFCLSVTAMASKARLTRSSILEVIRQDYIRTAWAKGLRERVIVIRHVLKNGMIPVITLIGLQVSNIFGGSVLIETVFNIPGMGRLIVSSVFAQDYSVIQGCSLIFAFVVVMVNLIVDISYGWLDPRIRYA